MSAERPTSASPAPAHARAFELLRVPRERQQIRAVMFTLVSWPPISSMLAVPSPHSRVESAAQSPAPDPVGLEEVRRSTPDSPRATIPDARIPGTSRAVTTAVNVLRISLPLNPLDLGLGGPVVSPACRGRSSRRTSVRKTVSPAHEQSQETRKNTKASGSDEAARAAVPLTTSPMGRKRTAGYEEHDAE